MLQIAQIILVIIRFFFKRYITVCFFVVEFVLEQSANPLYQINDIKEDVTQFFHLSGMYLLVIDCVLVDSYSMSGEKHTKQVDGCKSLEWDNVVIDNFHFSPFIKQIQ